MVYCTGKVDGINNRVFFELASQADMYRSDLEVAVCWSVNGQVFTSDALVGEIEDVREERLGG